jgi:hypothetical protein
MGMVQAMPNVEKASPHWRAQPGGGECFLCFVAAPFQMSTFSIYLFILSKAMIRGKAPRPIHTLTIRQLEYGMRITRPCTLPASCPA